MQISPLHLHNSCLECMSLSEGRIKYNLKRTRLLSKYPACLTFSPNLLINPRRWEYLYKAVKKLSIYSPYNPWTLRKSIKRTSKFVKKVQSLSLHMYDDGFEITHFTCKIIKDVKRYYPGLECLEIHWDLGFSMMDPRIVRMILDLVTSFKKLKKLAIVSISSYLDHIFQKYIFETLTECLPRLKFLEELTMTPTIELNPELYDGAYIKLHKSMCYVKNLNAASIKIDLSKYGRQILQIMCLCPFPKTLKRLAVDLDASADSIIYIEGFFSFVRTVEDLQLKLKNYPDFNSKWQYIGSAISKIQSLKHLEIIFARDFYEFITSSRVDNFFQGFGTMNKLESLKVYSYEDPLPGYLAKSLRNFPSLNTLDLSFSGATTKTLNLLGDSLLTSIQKLRLLFFHLRDEDGIFQHFSKCLKNIGQLKDFEFVIIRGKISCKSILYLASALEWCKELRAVNLKFGGIQIGRGLARLFSVLASLPKLCEISTYISPIDTIEPDYYNEIASVCFGKKKWIVQLPRREVVEKNKEAEFLCLVFLVFIIIKAVYMGKFLSRICV